MIFTTLKVESVQQKADKNFFLDIYPKPWHKLRHKICVSYLLSCSFQSDIVFVSCEMQWWNILVWQQQQQQQEAVDQSGSYSAGRAPQHTLHTRPRAVVGQGFDPQRLAQNIIHIYCSDGTSAEVCLEVWSLCQKESPHVHKLIIITVPSVLPANRLLSAVIPEGQFGFILCDKPSRLCNERQRRDEPPVLVVEAMWDLLFLINIHVVH